MSNLKTILIVDDDEGIRFVFSNILEKSGYEVVEAENGAKALEVLSEIATPVLIITDINMPKMNGYKLLAKIKGDPSLSTVPIAICSLENHAEDIAALIGAGYFKKLATPEDFLKQVEAEIAKNEESSPLFAEKAANKQ